jgi:hypothetical protein
MRRRGGTFRCCSLLVGVAGLVSPSACGGRAMLDDDPDIGLGAGRGGSRFESSGGASGRNGSGRSGSGGTVDARGGSAGAPGVAGTASGGRGIIGAAGAAMAGAAGTGMSGSAGALGSASGGAAGGGSDQPSPSLAFTGCALSTPLEGGFSRCANGLLHRPVAGRACPNALPRGRAFAPEVLLALEQIALGIGYVESDIPFLYLCREDTDCTDLRNGYCELTMPDGWDGSTSFTECRYACSTDADCGGGTLCECGDPGGQCLTARCFEDAECGAGRRCAPYDATPGCEFESRIWECQRLDDECSVDAHCGDGEVCLFIDGRRRCTPPVCP